MGEREEGGLDEIKGCGRIGGRGGCEMADEFVRILRCACVCVCLFV